ncbi:hypothetical protein ES703_85239 [subsurface metagenome]
MVRGVRFTEHTLIAFCQVPVGSGWQKVAGGFCSVILIHCPRIFHLASVLPTLDEVIYGFSITNFVVDSGVGGHFVGSFWER